METSSRRGLKDRSFEGLLTVKSSANSSSRSSVCAAFKILRAAFARVPSGGSPTFALLCSEV